MVAMSAQFCEYPKTIVLYTLHRWTIRHSNYISIRLLLKKSSI